jgi:hypothetical protein
VENVLGILISIPSHSSAVNYTSMVAITLDAQSAISDSNTKCL